MKHTPSYHGHEHDLSYCFVCPLRHGIMDELPLVLR